MQTLQQKTRKFLQIYYTDIHSATALRLKIKVLRVGILGEDCLNGGDAAISDLRANFTTIASAPSKAARISALAGV